MVPDNNPTTQQLPQCRFTLLLVALAFVLTIAPLLEGTRLGRTLYAAAITAVFITGVLVNRRRKWALRTEAVLAALAIPVCWSAALTTSHILNLAEYIIITVFCSVTAALILVAVFRDYQATTQAIVGAICVYLLLGLTWTMVYAMIEYVEVEPFSFPSHHQAAAVDVERPSLSQLIYFSFVTMTALGYGDITPRTEMARTASYMQAIVGQIYIVVLIARLVAVLPMRKGKGDASTP
jgi:hypothetical protein